jgi:hypothetical protein
MKLKSILQKTGALILIAILSLPCSKSFCQRDVPVHVPSPGELPRFRAGIYVEVSSVSLPDIQHGAFSVPFNLSNFNSDHLALDGYVTAIVTHKSFPNNEYDTSTKYNVKNLVYGLSLQGSLLFRGVHLTPDAEIQIFYYKDTLENVGIRNPRTGITNTMPLLIGVRKATSVYNIPFTDNDRDSINDAKEDALLAQFRPYFRFSAGDGKQTDQFAPSDVLRYITMSDLRDGEYDYTHQMLHESPKRFFSNQQLSAQPSYILNADIDNNHDKYCALNGSDWNCYSDITKNFRITQYCINPNDAAIHGNAWADIAAQGNIGLYGHVVPLVLDSVLVSQDQLDIFDYAALDPSKYPAKDLRLYFKIEYWQFFGYNRDSHDGCPELLSLLIPANFELSAIPGECVADHEGDWCTVQLLVDQNDNIVSVYHFAHGKMMKFDMAAQNSVIFSGNGNEFEEIRGNNFTQNLDLKSAGTAVNGIVTLYRESATAPYIHPVVFIEYGGHEFWPSKYWSYPEVYAHDGDGEYQYLTATPPNLGEVEFPLSEYPSANLLMRFNGLWGTVNYDNDPPQGPPLHKQWNWPQSSSIRWLIDTTKMSY